MYLAKRRARGGMTRSDAEKIARYSWQIPLITIVLMAVFGSIAKSPTSTMIIAGTFFLLLLAGFICGVIACVSSKRHGSHKILVPGLIGALLSLSIPGVVVGVAVPTYIAAKSNRIENYLQQSADEWSKEAPLMVDEATRLDCVSVGVGDELDFNYTLVQISIDDIDVDEFTETMTPHLRDVYMNNPQMEWFREHGIIHNHIYRDQDGVLIASISIGGEE
jgi:hypothetical protein